MVEILNNVVHHLYQNDLFLWNNPNQMTLIFFNSFSTSKFFVLFEVIFLLRLNSIASKSVIVIKFACANFALKTLVAKTLNFELVMYLSWSWLVTFYSSSLIFVW